MLATSYHDRALMRLLCMGGVSSLETAELFHEIWTDLEISTKDILIATLNIDGAPSAPTVQPIYIPADLTYAIDGDRLEAREEKRLLLSYLPYIARIITLEVELDSSATVIQLDMLDILKEIIQSSGFRADPTILERAVVSDSTVCFK
jgi:hypothetical protein